MRRRHQKNPLLMRIIGISILFHIIALPILAHFGALKKIQERFAGPQIVFVPPPPPPETEKHEAKQKQAPKHQQIARRSTHTEARRTQSQPKQNLNTPHVIEGAKGGAGTAGEVAQGSGQVGVVPTEKTAPAATAEKPAEPVKPVEKIAEKPAEPVKPVEKPVKPIEKPAEPVKPVEPVKPAEPVYTAAEPMGGQQPQPVIPDDLRLEALDKTCVVEFSVGPDGRPTSVRITSSTNIQELDRLALDAARQWRFKPATRDGQPVESRVRLHVQFQVS